MKNWKGVPLITFVSVIVIGGLLFWLGWSGDTNEIKSAANQFKPDASWKLVSEHATPPKTLCFDEICPSVSKKWRLEKAMTQRDDFAKIAKINGQNFTISDQCFNQSGELNSIDYCEAALQQDKHTFTLTYRVSNDKPEVTLNTREN